MTMNVTAHALVAQDAILEGHDATNLLAPVIAHVRRVAYEAGETDGADYVAEHGAEAGLRDTDGAAESLINGIGSHGILQQVLQIRAPELDERLIWDAIRAEFCREYQRGFRIAVAAG